MNKKERRQAQLLKHYAALENLKQFWNSPSKKTGKQLSTKLIALENKGAKFAMYYANGQDEKGNSYSTAEYNRDAQPIIEAVKSLFECKELPGFFDNTDPRGHFLKVKEDVQKATDLFKDWGGYGLLAPEINGN